MSMGIVSDSDFLSELSRLGGKNPTPENEPPVPTIEELPTPGRNEHDKNVPNSLRSVIAETAISNGSRSANELARAFDISSSSVSAYKNGATSTASYDEPQPELSKRVKAARFNIANRAQDTLLEALNHLTNEKLENAKARDIASIAKDMSAVVKNMTTSDDDDDDGKKGPQVNITFFAPVMRKESDFEVIEVRE